MSGLIPTSEAVKAFKQRTEHETQERLRDELISVNSQIFDKASAYTNLVIVAGYAGFLTVWTNVRTTMTHRELVASGLAIFVSLAVFVVWEIFTMIYLARAMQQFARVAEAPPSKVAEIFGQMQRAQQRAVLRNRALWMWALLATLIPGLFAAGVLFTSLLRNLFQVT